ncbi:hypothetical protein O1M54_44820 [Streptomyces diastatochromogenes]|nr:hypothetical protein [Streptomyces diastatochromogenes]
MLADGLRLPEGRMEPRLFGLPEGQLFEVYVDQLPPQVRAPDCGSGAHARPSPWELPESAGPARLGEVESQALRRQTAEAMRAHQRTRGTLPVGWQRWAEEVLEPTVDWRRALSGAVRKPPHGPPEPSTTPTAAPRAAPRRCAASSCRACAARCRGWPSSSTPPVRWGRRTGRRPRGGDGRPARGGRTG